jgi:hypothetical protein
LNLAPFHWSIVWHVSHVTGTLPRHDPPVLKKSRWLLLKREENLKTEQLFRLRDLLRYNLKTVRAYVQKEAFQQLWDYSSPTWAGEILVNNLEIDPTQVYRGKGPLSFSRLMGLTALERPDLKDAPFTPAAPESPVPQSEDEDLFARIRRQDILLHHPFDSFQPIVDFMAKAARDPGRVVLFGMFLWWSDPYTGLTVALLVLTVALAVKVLSPLRRSAQFGPLGKVIFLLWLLVGVPWAYITSLVAHGLGTEPFKTRSSSSAFVGICAPRITRFRKPSQREQIRA